MGPTETSDPGPFAAGRPEPRTGAYVAAQPGVGVWPDERPLANSRLLALGAVALLFVIGVGTVLCLGGFAGAAAMMVRAPDLQTLAEDPMSLMSGAVMALTFFSGFGGFAVLGAIALRLFGWRFQHTLALRRPTVAALIFGLIGGLYIGVFPGWMAEQITTMFPDLQNGGTLDAISRMLSEGTFLDRAAMVLTVCVGAPLLEEICFRGLLWNATERVAPGWMGQTAALVVTTLAFLLAHADPVQSPALLLTAIFLGVLRLSSGSLWPCILAHFVNNTLATVLTFAFLDAEADSALEVTPLWVAILALVLSLATLGALFALRRRPLATPEDAWAQAEAT